MKNLTIDAAILADSYWDAAVRRATGVLDEELGTSSALVSAEWGLKHDDRDRPLITLRLSDWTGSVEAAFTPDDLRNDPQLRWRLRRVWGDLLQVRSHKQLSEIQASSDVEAL